MPSSTLFLLCVCCVKSVQWCLTLCDPMDCSPTVSSVRGILQARILEWVALPFFSKYIKQVIKVPTELHRKVY